MTALTEAQARFLEGTRAADVEGRPLVLHHGTPFAFERFERTTDIGFHFGSRVQADRRLKDMDRKERARVPSGQDRVVSVALRTTNPLVLPEDPRTWNPEHVFDLLRRFTTAEDRRIVGIAAAESKTDVASRPRNRATVFGILRRALQDAGHDSIVYRNQYESAVRSRGVDWSWVALDADAILILPKDPGTDALAWPDGSTRPAGISPDAHVAEIGGLRRANGKVAKVAERRAFRKEAVDRISSVLGDLTPYVVRKIDWMDDWRARRHLEGRYVSIDVNPEIGRMTLDLCALAIRHLDGQVDWSFDDAGRVAALLEGDRFVEALTPLTEYGGPSISESRMGPEFFYSRQWQPGERMSDVIGEFVDVLRSTLDLLPPLGKEPAAPAP